MQDLLQKLPADMQLQIYDLFLALRAYQRQCHFHTICTMIMEDIDQDAGTYFDYISITGADIIDLSEDEDLFNDLPSVIRIGYDLIHLMWFDVMANWGRIKLSMCSFPLDECKTCIQVFRLDLSNHSWEWEAIYDIHTFEFVMYISKSNHPRADFENLNMVEVMKICLVDEARIEEQLEDNDEDLVQCRQWLKDISENNFATTTFSDEYTKMRSFLHERCLSRLSRKRSRGET